MRIYGFDCVLFRIGEGHEQYGRPVQSCEKVTHLLRVERRAGNVSSRSKSSRWMALAGVTNKFSALGFEIAGEQATIHPCFSI